MTRAVQLSSGSNEHYGPAYLGAMAREVMGGIDLDPASCAQANTLIGARFYYSLERGEDGLEEPWAGRVYLNPPGGKSVKWEGRRVNSAALWWYHLMVRYELGWVEEAIVIVFNLELFRYALGFPVAHPLDFAICFPEDRIDFMAPGPDGVPVEQGSPGHPNAIVYVGREDCALGLFREVFTKPRPGYGGGRVFFPGSL